MPRAHSIRRHQIITLIYFFCQPVVNLKRRISISEVYQQGSMSYIPETISSKSQTDERRGRGTLSQRTRRVNKRLDSGGKRPKKKEGLFPRKLISRGFLVVKEAYPSPSFVYYIYPKNNLNYTTSSFNPDI